MLQKNGASGWEAPGRTMQTHYEKSLIGEDVDFSGSKFLSLPERQGEDTIAVGGFDVLDIEILVEFDFELEAESLVLAVFEVAFDLLSFAADGQDPFFKVHFKVFPANTREGNGEFESGFVGAGFKAWSFGGNLRVHDSIFLELKGYEISMLRTPFSSSASFLKVRSRTPFSSLAVTPFGSMSSGRV